MKLFIYLLLMVPVVLSGSAYPQDEIEFVCFRTHKASNTCHFNFRVNGANYRYVDNGCRYNKKQEELIRKVTEGSIFLAKDWKIECPPQKKPAQ
jgi:hypothetical protein